MPIIVRGRDESPIHPPIPIVVSQLRKRLSADSQLEHVCSFLWLDPPTLDGGLPPEASHKTVNRSAENPVEDISEHAISGMS